ncbi:DNA adenine methylase [Pantoea sp. Fr+CA_20]|uniref:DNA adenine methylase n=1 Tax=Pantoea TaxID=53335 RepID=UPI00211799CB|nr:DNA adenine methylase [Pantoea sp. Fr+CA_20]
MPQTPSPLRYPGGKTSIVDMVSKIIESNKLTGGHYAEPYAGGAGLALSLLFNGKVHEIHLNDLDKAVWSFWNSIINRTSDFIDKIIETEVTIDEWKKQREIQLNRNLYSDFELGFSSFFLNRTNRSGVILKAGVIGGIKQQGQYKLGCRFNKDGLIKKIKRISKYKHRIHVYNLDAVDFIKNIDSSCGADAFLCIDPPYYNKGSTLYTNFYEPRDHEYLSNIILSIKKPWILTYDNAMEISELYKKRRQFNFNLNYSAATKRVGTELLVVSKGLKIPNDLNIVKK